MPPDPEPLAGFGLALYRLRVARGWSLRQAGLAAGVSVTTVMRAEQGRPVGLAGAYGTTVGALLDEAEIAKRGQAAEVSAQGRPT